ncbi:hypothetical protein SGPA1_50073 [Streptomyces misionensis JCM 4497]
MRRFAPKTVDARRRRETIRTLHAGNRWVNPELASDANPTGDSPPPAREAEVLEPAADGAPVTEIAERAVLPPGTARNHLSSAVTEIGAENPACGSASRTPERLGIVAVAPRRSADVAQLVERNLAKVEVASSSLVVRSTEKTPVHWTGVFFVP